MHALTKSFPKFKNIEHAGYDEKHTERKAREVILRSIAGELNEGSLLVCTIFRSRHDISMETI